MGNYSEVVLEGILCACCGCLLEDNIGCIGYYEDCKDDDEER